MTPGLIWRRSLTWSIVLSTFGLVFLAELGDKTQLAVMTQTCKFRKPWAVLAGGSLALTLATAVGALGGNFLSTLLPPALIRTTAAVAFLVMGLLMLREATNSSDNDGACEFDDGRTDVSGWDWRAFGTTFSLLFAAELGDKTQLAILGLAASQRAAWEIFLGGALALISVTALGVACGQWIVRWVPERWLLRISGALFFMMGLLMIGGIL